MLGARHRVRKGGLIMNPEWSKNQGWFRMLSMRGDRGLQMQ